MSQALPSSGPAPWAPAPVKPDVTLPDGRTVRASQVPEGLLDNNAPPAFGSLSGSEAEAIESGVAPGSEDDLDGVDPSSPEAASALDRLKKLAGLSVNPAENATGFGEAGTGDAEAPETLASEDAPVETPAPEGAPAPTTPTPEVDAAKAAIVAQRDELKADLRAIREENAALRKLIEERTAPPPAVTQTPPVPAPAPMPAPEPAGLDSEALLAEAEKAGLDRETAAFMLKIVNPALQAASQAQALARSAQERAEAEGVARRAEVQNAWDARVNRTLEAARAAHGMSVEAFAQMRVALDPLVGSQLDPQRTNLEVLVASEAARLAPAFGGKPKPPVAGAPQGANGAPQGAPRTAAPVDAGRGGPTASPETIRRKAAEAAAAPAPAGSPIASAPRPAPRGMVEAQEYLLADLKSGKFSLRGPTRR